MSATHVALNATWLDPQRSSGPETYLRALVPALAAHRPTARLMVVSTRRGARALRDAGWSDWCTVVTLPVDEGQRLRRLWADMRGFPAAARSAGCDVLHSLASTGPRRPSVPHVLTLHDLIFERERTLGPVSTLARRVLVRWAAGGAAAIITGTESARREIQRDLRLRSDAITVIHHGPGRDPVSPKPVPHALVDRPFILSVGALRPHKSQVVMVRALAHLPDDIHLVVCGYEERYATTIATEAASLGLAARVHLLGYVDDGVLEALWGAASCAASASRAEGFGLTLLEAMRRGVPSVCSDLEVTREVGGDAAYYFAVDDPADAARAVRAAMEDPRAGERGRARASMFSWAAAAAKTWEVYDRVARAAM